MGYPVRSLIQFEEKLTRYREEYREKWALVIFANPRSDSKAVEFIIRNFHIMDTLSNDVDFFLPGYCLTWDRSELAIPDKWMERELNESHDDFHSSTEKSGFWDRVRGKEQGKGYALIESPRIGSVYFSDADYADFVMEFTRKKRNYVYSGSCELILMPVCRGQADYLAARVYDLDAIIDCPSGNSLDQFMHRLFQVMRGGDRSNHMSPFRRLFDKSVEVIREAERLYSESITPRYIEDRYEIVIKKVVQDIERCVNWSLTDEFYFISYSTRNTMMAEYLKREMQSRGKNVWIAPDGIPQGREYSLVIPTTLKLAKTFILLLTPDSAKSHWVKRELDIAISNGPDTKVKVILADGFTIDDIRKDNELYFYLNRVQVKYEYDDIVNSSDLFDEFLNR